MRRVGPTRQRVCMGVHSAGKAVQIVTTFEDRDEPSARVFVGYL